MKDLLVNIKVHTQKLQLQECPFLLLITSYIFLLRLLFNYNQLTGFFPSLLMILSGKSLSQARQNKAFKERKTFQFFWNFESPKLFLPRGIFPPTHCQRGRPTLT